MVSEFYSNEWTAEDWKIEVDERMGIKMDSGIEESEAMKQTKEELKGHHKRWKGGISDKQR